MRIVSIFQGKLACDKDYCKLPIAATAVETLLFEHMQFQCDGYKAPR